jgi:hypothetical protein
VPQTIADHQPDPPPSVIIPPRISAVLGTEDADAARPRDCHIRPIRERGRTAWQRETGYGRRSPAEIAVGRYKTIVGPKLRARSLPAQQGEAAIAVTVLNRMIRPPSRRRRTSSCASTGSISQAWRTSAIMNDALRRPKSI